MSTDRKTQYTKHAIRVIAVVVVMIGAAQLVSRSEASTARRYSAKSIKFVKNELYQEECGACHVGFLPGFLPNRSWKKLMDGLEDHFGEDASLDKDDERKIRSYLTANAADAKRSSRRSKKIARLISKQDAPLRITETEFWERKHYSIKRYVWEREAVKSKANCNSCHRDAAKGIYSEYDVQIPK